MGPLDPLIQSLASPKPVYVLVGPEGWLVREGEAAVRAEVAKGPMAALNHLVFTAGEEAALGFSEAARTVPMMAARRLVEVRQVQDANKALLEALLAYVQAPVESAVLVISGEKFPGAIGGTDWGLRIQNQVKKVGLLLKLDGEGVDPVDFAMARARERGARLEPDGARALVELGGGELSLLANDLDKCFDFVGPGGVVTRAVAEEVVAATAEADVWALTDALVARDRDRALATLHRLLEDGEPSHKLFGSVAWQLRQVLLVQDAARRGLGTSGVRMPPQKLRAVQAMVQKRPMSPSQVLEELAQANHGMNSSRAGDRRVFEALILRLTGV
jgi:DNA polymerase-3 subunit delta